MDFKEEDTRVTKAHSVKVPQLYKIACKVLKKIQDNGEGIKTALYSARHPNVKGITALVTETLKRNGILEILLTKSKICESESGLDAQLAKILITELLWGKKRLGGDAKPVLTVKRYEKKFHSILTRLERKNRNREDLTYGSLLNGEREFIRKPRYIRVNTLVNTLFEVIDILVSEGWNEKNPPPEDLLQLQENEFCKDSFVDNLLVFPSSTEFHSHALYEKGAIILQDKASCLPSLALKPRRGRSVIDACAAPGMKTSHLASMIGNEGRILAIEKNENRVNTLEKMKDWLGLTCVQVLQSNFTDIDPLKHPDVEYILLDPSCSGSGMTSRIKLHENETRSKERLETLAFYQMKLILHAMKFPGVRRIVYSTCSTYSIENEDVIAAVLEETDAFILKNTLPNWTHRLTNPNYEWSSRCAIANYECDRTDGFFVALFERSK